MKNTGFSNAKLTLGANEQVNANGTLTAKDMLEFTEQQDNNQALHKVDKQLVEMDRDYNVMLLERIESKK